MYYESVYDRQQNEDYKVQLVELGDGTFARSVLNVPGHEIDVLLSDQHTPSFDALLGIQQQSGIVLTSDALKNTRIMNVSASHGFIPGSYLALSSPTKIYLGYVVSVNVNEITLDRLLPEDFTVAETSILRGIDNLNVAGSAASPITAWIGGLGYSGKIDITNLVISITSTGVPAWDEYGDITKLSYGCTVRVVYDKDLPSEQIQNICNIKSNGHLAYMSDSIDMFEESKPIGVNGIVGRLGFGGQEKRGVVIRLGANDQLQYVIQDDLSSLIEHKVMVRGHIVLD